MDMENATVEQLREEIERRNRSGEAQSLVAELRAGVTGANVSRIACALGMDEDTVRAHMEVEVEMFAQACGVDD